MRELPTYTPDFEEYIRQGEPGKKERAQIWRTAIGLQQVDGLCISDYMKELVRRNIEGELSMAEVRKLIDEHYKGIRPKRKPRNDYYGYVRCSKEFTTSFEEHIQRHKANVGIKGDNVGINVGNVTGNTQNVTVNVTENGIGNAQDVIENVGKSTLKSTLKSALKGTRKNIVDIIAQDPNVTIPQVAEQLGKHVRGIAKHFGNLQAEGYIRRVGADKGGHWEVLPPQVPPQAPPQVH